MATHSTLPTQPVHTTHLVVEARKSIRLFWVQFAALFGLLGWYSLLAVAALGEIVHWHWFINRASIEHNATLYRTTLRHVGAQMKHTSVTWHHTNWSKDKALQPIIGSLAWANLVFGESLALVGQGLVQRGQASGVVSFLTHMGIAAFVEFIFAYPIARKNDKSRVDRHILSPSKERLFRASTVSFWLGGAMGIEQERLGRKHLPLAIGSYLSFAVLLALVGNWNDFAAQLIEQPAFFVILVVAGAVKKINDLCGYEGALERLAKRSVRLSEKFVARQRR